MGQIITQSNMVTEFHREDGHKVEGQDLILAKSSADLLEKHYPGHLWAVYVNSEGGVMNIKALNISGLYGMVIHLKTIYQDPTLKTVVRFAGEFLERAHLRRGRNTGEDPKILEGAKAKHQPKNGIII